MILFSSIAALLLQMPEEQAFGVLVKVMHELGLRDMFRENFEQLQLRLYQLDRLVENMMPDLHVHFQGETPFFLFKIVNFVCKNFVK